MRSNSMRIGFNRTSCRSRLFRMTRVGGCGTRSEEPVVTTGVQEDDAMKPARTVSNQSWSIVALDKFIQATRDSGYKGTASAISELVDNSIEAGATRISISVTAGSEGGDLSIEVSVLDNGCGMDPVTLRQALRFGGTTRFGDRSGLGRYGMGLPNASLSQARQVRVYTWQAKAVRQSSRGRGHTNPFTVYSSHLDVDAIVRGEMQEVPRPARVKSPPAACKGRSGTLVVWTRCDRLDNRRPSTIGRKLEAELGRRFRHYIWKGLRISVNGSAVKAVDPLCLHPDAEVSGARPYGQSLRYEVRADPTDPRVTGWVTVRFAELPVQEWYRLSNDVKRRIGLTRGAGVSIIRAGREVDYGWIFMGAKRRENYDDWWRCEIEFEPILDEVFGITHTKQQVRPRAELVEALTPDIEAMARVLNSRARKAHMAAKTAEQFSEAEKLATDRDRLLEPLPTTSRSRDKGVLDQLKKCYPELRKPTNKNGNLVSETSYKIIEAAVSDTSFFNYARQDGRVILVLNPNHPFYKQIYRQLAESDMPRDRELRTQLELLLLAAARSEATETSPRAIPQIERQRQRWSDTLATFLNG